MLFIRICLNLILLAYTTQIHNSHAKSCTRYRHTLPYTSHTLTQQFGGYFRSGIVSYFYIFFQCVTNNNFCSYTNNYKIILYVKPIQSYQDIPFVTLLIQGNGQSTYFYNLKNILIFSLTGKKGPCNIKTCIYIFKRILLLKINRRIT